MSKTLTFIALVLLIAPAAIADWDPGDGHKMHYPQMPDPNGWDVRNGMGAGPGRSPTGPAGVDFGDFFDWRLEIDPADKESLRHRSTLGAWPRRNGARMHMQRRF